MKKILLLILAICVSFSSCSKNEKTVVEEKNIEKSARHSRNKEKAIDFENYKAITPEVFKHVQTIKLDFEKQVYKETLNSEILCTLNDGDVITTSEVLEYAPELIYLKISTDSIKEGFINIQENPYENGKYSDAGTLIVDGKEVKLIKMPVQQYFDEGSKVMSEPSENSKVIYTTDWRELNQPISISMITETPTWWKVKIRDKEGWINYRNIDYTRDYYKAYDPDFIIESQVLRYPH